MSFIQYLKEAIVKPKAIVFAFGRMSPPTIGHGLLVKKVMDEAKTLKADHVIYLSKSQDPKKNPLDVKTKVMWARKMFPGANIEPATAELATFIDCVKMLNKKYKVLYMVAGSDRLEEYTRILNKYNGTEFHYDTIKLISAGERDPDADGAAGMSATKMREAASKNDLANFKKGLPKHMESEAKRMMDDVRTGMKL